MEEIFRLGAIHRICIRKAYITSRLLSMAETKRERSFYRGMLCAYERISDCFTRSLDDVLSESYSIYGKSK